jgi:CubicO group peptidase (beta-lactamase class C family)
VSGAGKIRLDGKVSDYVPYYPRETGTKITVDQLLNHTSGLQQDIAFSDNPHDIPPIITKINADLLSNDELVKLIAARPLHGNSLVSQRSKDLLFAPRKVSTAYGWKTAEEEWGGGKRHKVLRTTGGLPGFVNLLLRMPEEERVIILLSNTRGSVYWLDDIAQAVNRILDNAPYEKPKRSIAETSLELNPQNTNAAEMLKRLRAN